MNPLLLTRGVFPHVSTTSESSWWADKMTGLDGTGDGRKCRSHDGGKENRKSPCDFSMSLQQMIIFFPPQFYSYPAPACIPASAVAAVEVQGSSCTGKTGISHLAGSRLIAIKRTAFIIYYYVCHSYSKNEIIYTDEGCLS